VAIGDPVHLIHIQVRLSLIVEAASVLHIAINQRAQQTLATVVMVVGLIVLPALPVDQELL
jgi:hypothetical protein